MKDKYKIIGIILMVSIVLTSCQSLTRTDDGFSKTEELNKEILELNAKIEELTEKNEELNTQLNSNNNPPQSQNLLSTALDVIEIIKNKDMTNLSNYIDLNKGLRFTPYFYVDIQNDQVFNAQQVAGLTQDSTIYNWGDYDGSGDPIDLNFNDYYEKFIYDNDFINPHIIGNNVPIGFGNEIDNVSTVYPNARFVEFHFTGFDPQYDGIDWSSLRLVFEKSGSQWYLVGIIHGQWTI